MCDVLKQILHLKKKYFSLTLKPYISRFMYNLHNIMPKEYNFAIFRVDFRMSWKITQEKNTKIRAFCMKITNFSSNVFFLFLFDRRVTLHWPVRVAKGANVHQHHHLDEQSHFQLILFFSYSICIVIDL